MQTKEKVILFWSGGKDSALALHKLKQDENLEIVGLVTTINRDNNHVPFHGLPDKIILEQAKLLNLPLQRIFIPKDATNAEYISEVSKILKLYAKVGIKKAAFGDINQKEIREFKESFLRELGMSALFPLAHMTSLEVAQEFLATNHKAIVTAVSAEKLGYSYLAKEYNQEFLDRLPTTIDPAGENGEFHTFVIYGPHFKMRVAFSKAIAIEEGPYLVSLIKEP